MKAPTLVLLFWLAGLASLCSADLRIWTNTSGKTISARLMEIVPDAQGQASAVQIALPDGQKHTLALSSLSEADREYIAAVQKEKLAEELKDRLKGRKAKWTTDWETALAESKATGLPILMFRTGSDWCGFCMNLKATVFSSRDFQRYADDHWVLMEADYPRNIKQPAKLREQNLKLLKDIRGGGGFPTVLIIQDGKIVSQKTGYGGDRPKDYIKALVGGPAAE